jgi:hypothetical protein
MKDIDVSLNFDVAMVNSYKLIMGLKNINELLEESPETLFLVFDPDDYDRDEVIMDLIDYFEDTEEYEFCANLKKTQIV